MTSFHLMLGREPRTVCNVQVPEDSEEVQLEPVDEAKLREQLNSIADIQEGLHQRVKARVATDRKSSQD